jgi:hypothetical protein
MEDEGLLDIDCADLECNFSQSHLVGQQTPSCSQKELPPKQQRSWPLVQQNDSYFILGLGIVHDSSCGSQGTKNLSIFFPE